MNVLFSPIHKDVIIPTRAHDHDAGLDVYACQDGAVYPGKNRIPMGFAIEIPIGYAAFLTPRSNMMDNGCIQNFVPCDPKYKGEVHWAVYNASDEIIEFKKDERVAQLLFIPIAYFTPVLKYNNERGTGGFGSSGK